MEKKKSGLKLISIDAHFLKNFFCVRKVCPFLFPIFRSWVSTNLRLLPHGVLQKRGTDSIVASVLVSVQQIYWVQEITIIVAFHLLVSLNRNNFSLLPPPTGTQKKMEVGNLLF